MRIACLLAGPIVLALASPVCAQLTEKQALAQMKSDLKAAVKEFKLALGGTAQIFQGHLDQEVAQLVSGASTTLEFAVELPDHVAELQAGVRTAIGFAALRAEEAAVPALAGLAEGTDLTLGYPAPFVNGSGSTLDKYEADIRKALGKTYAALNKSLAKAAKLMEKHDLGLTWRLSPPTEFLAYEANPAGGSVDDSTALRVDAVFAVGELDLDDDGYLVVCGTCNGAAGDLSLQFVATDIAENTIGIGIGEVDDRWDVTIGPVPEGNYIFVASEETGTSFTSASLGLR